MNSALDFLTQVFNWLKEQGPAIAILIYDWQNAEKEKAIQAQKEAEFELQIEKNHEKVDADNVGVSDSDGLKKITGSS